MAANDSSFIPARAPAAASVATARPQLLPRELSEDELSLFRSAGQARRVPAGATIFRRGELGRSMFLVDTGRVKLEFGDGLSEKLIGPREFFGELALFIGNHARVASAVAAEDCALYVIEHAEFERILESAPAVMARFMRRSFSYLVSSEQQLIHGMRRRNGDLLLALDSLRQTQNELTGALHLVRTDELTGLANRRGLYQFVDSEFAAAAAGGQPALLLVDVDRFKQINDAFGHLTGDAVLQAIADEVRAAALATDLPCRLGGDEFALLTMAADAGDLANRAVAIVAAVRRLRFAPPNEGLRVSVSVGACLCAPSSAWPSWYSDADSALYQAKGSGGDGWKLSE